MFDAVLNMLDRLPNLSGSAEAGMWLSIGAAFAAAACVILALPRHASGDRVGSVPMGPVPPLWRLAWPLVRALEAPAALTIGAQRRIVLQGLLQRAGVDRWLTPSRYRAGCWAMGVSGALAAALSLGLVRAAFSASLSLPDALSGVLVDAIGGEGILLPFIAGLVAASLPAARLRDRAAARQRALLRQLPFYLDLITLSVEAGLNLGAALAQSVDRGPPGPMRDELSQLLGDLRAGRSRDESLRALADRVRQPAVSNLVAALATAQKQGASLGPILRLQAEQRRVERFLRAEKLAMEAPVKMLVPLVLFIFPGTFAVLLFPVVSRLIAEGVL